MLTTQRKPAKILALGAVICLTLTSCTEKHPVGGFYPGVEIGPALMLLPRGQRSSSEPSQTSYVRYIRGGFISMADHMLRTSSSTPPYVAFFMTGSLKNDKLDETVKRTELIHADFGSISLQKTCFYNRSFDFNRNALAIGRYDVQAEPAQPTPDPPLTTQEGPSFFALLRVYQDGPGAIVLTGNYEADGRLGSLHVDHTRGGARLFYPEDGIALVANDHSGVPTKLRSVDVGFPLTLDFVSASKTLRLPPAPLPVLREALFTVFGDGELVREDSFSRGASGTVLLKTTRYLRPSVVEEQRELDPACNAQLAKQRASQEGTVE